jgi:hypothetical protein
MAGQTHPRLHHGFTIDEQVQQPILAVPAIAWAPAYDGDGKARNGAWVAEITGMPALAGWLTAMVSLFTGYANRTSCRSPCWQPNAWAPSRSS